MPRLPRRAGSSSIWHRRQSASRKLGFEGLERRWLLNGSAEANVLLQPSPATAVYGQDVTLSATVTAAVGGGSNPTGTVTFEVGSTVLGTSTVNATSGVATLDTTRLPVGSDTLTALYSGDVNFASNQITAPETVSQDNTVTQLLVSQSPILAGQTLVITAAVLPASPGSGAPTGTVNFYDGTTLLGTETLNHLDDAVFRTSTLALGPHTLSAVYSGDTNFLTSPSPNGSTQVNQATTTTTLVASPSGALTGAPVTLTATVSAGSNGPAQGGTVAFMDGSTTLATVAVGFGGRAVYQTSSLAAGSHSLTAVYSGSTADLGSPSNTVTENIGAPVTTTTTLHESTATSVTGQNVTFTAVVSPVSAGTPMTGTVSFMEGSTVLGQQTVGGRFGTVATFSTTSLALGANLVTAVYSGDANYSTSTSAAVTETVSQGNSTVTIYLSSPSSGFGQSVQAFAVVNAQPRTLGNPTGTVTFYADATQFGQATVSWHDAIIALPNLPVGTHSITAVYSGDATFTTATSAAVNETVSQGTARINVSSSPGTPIVGQSVTLTATLGPGGQGFGGFGSPFGLFGFFGGFDQQSTTATLPTGTVSFMDGTTLLGSAPIGTGGQASISTTALVQGSNNITVVYSGDSNYKAGTSSTFRENVAPDNLGTVTGSGTVNSGALSFSISAQGNLATGAVTYSGTLQFTDTSKAVSLTETSITSLQVNAAGTQATINGMATVNGNAGYYFEINLTVGTTSTFQIWVNGPAQSHFFYYNSGQIDAGGSLAITPAPGSTGTLVGTGGRPFEQDAGLMAFLNSWHRRW